MKQTKTVPVRKFFQARTEKRLTFRQAPSGIFGAVTRDPLPDGTYGAAIPEEISALARTVRLHEADHLKYQTPIAGRRRFQTAARVQGSSEDCINLADQGIEDAFISTVPVWASRPMSVRRDAAASGLRELRNAIRNRLKGAEPMKDAPLEIQDAYRANLLTVALRDVGLLVGAHLHSPCKNERVNGSLKKLIGQLSVMLPVDVRAMVKHIRDGDLASARALALEAIKPTQLPPLSGPDIPPGEAEPDYEQDEDRELNGVRTGDVEQGAKISIIRPPLTCPCQVGDGEDPTEEYASSGYRIRSRALVGIGLGIPSSSAFIRRLTPTPGGVVVFDASGSMHVDADKLRRVCRATPAATVVYYSGTDDMRGSIVVYAQGGMRLEDSVPLPDLDDGNTADEAAVLFGLRERARQGFTGPMILVSDLGFCGNTEASKHRALALVREGMQDGSIRVISSINEALHEFEHTAGERVEVTP